MVVFTAVLSAHPRNSDVPGPMPPAATPHDPYAAFRVPAFRSYSARLLCVGHWAADGEHRGWIRDFSANQLRYSARTGRAGRRVAGDSARPAGRAGGRPVQSQGHPAEHASRSPSLLPLGLAAISIFARRHLAVARCLHGIAVAYSASLRGLGRRTAASTGNRPHARAAGHHRDRPHVWLGSAGRVYFKPRPARSPRATPSRGTAVTSRSPR